MSEEIIRALGLWLHGGACKWGVSLHRIAYARYHRYQPRALSL